MPSLTNTASFHSQDQLPLYTTVNARHRQQSPAAAKQQKRKPHTSPSSSSVPNLPALHQPPQTRPNQQSWSFLHSLLLQDEEEMTDPNSDQTLVLNESKRNSQAGPMAARKKFRPHPPSKQEYDGSLGLSSRSVPDMRRDFLDSLSGNHGSARATVHSDVGQRFKPQKRSSDANRQVKEYSPCDLDSTNDGYSATIAVCQSSSQDPVNQWTSCRALPDPWGEDSGADGDENNDMENSARHSQTVRSETRSPEIQRFSEPSSPSTQTRNFSRSTSIASNLSWRKRPLLLPPIMLPPIYKMKPTPLTLRDDVYFAGTGARARRHISDDEWEDLKGCRYLRIRPMKRPLKI